MSTLDKINTALDTIPAEVRNVYTQINPLSIRSSIVNLVRSFGLQNVKVPDARSNPYNDASVMGAYIPFDATRSAKMGGMGGIPVFVDLVLCGPSGDPNKRDTYRDNITNKIIGIPTIKFEAVLCTIDIVANIVKTQIQGRNGTVKEYIGMDDAKVIIQGVIAGTNGVYPQTEVSELYKWAIAPVSKGVVCPYLQNLGIDKLVVEDVNIPQIAGGYSYQTFTINCISDLPVELKLL